MRAFSKDNNDSRLERHLVNDTMSQPTLTIQPPSTMTTPSNVDLGSFSLRDMLSYSSGVQEVPEIHRASVLDESGKRIVRNPSQAYECPFDRLGCSRIFHSFVEWYKHSLIHFGSHLPPSHNRCCFCTTTFDETNSMLSWRSRLKHVKLHHDQGERLATSRFDTELYRYLWQKNLIKDVEYKDLTCGPSALPISRPSGLHHLITRTSRIRPGGPGDRSVPSLKTTLHGTDINSLWSAASNGRRRAVKTMIDCEPSLIHSLDLESRSALIYASQNGHGEVVIDLLGAGANVNIVDVYKRCSLSYAAENGHGNVVQSLLRAGASPESSDMLERRPLSYAVQNGHKDVVRLLLSWGTDIAAKDSHSRTTLPQATLHGQKAVTKVHLAVKPTLGKNDINTDSGYASQTVDSMLAYEPNSLQDGTRTIYSFNSVTEQKMMICQLTFVSKILEFIQSKQIDEDLLRRMLLVLPDILKSFAIKLGYDAKQEKDYDAMFFVLKYRNMITDTIQEQWQKQIRTTVHSTLDELHKQEQIKLWQDDQARYDINELVCDDSDSMNSDVTTSSEPKTRAGDCNTNTDCISDADIGNSSIDLSFVTTSRAYTWLISKLASYLMLSSPNFNALTTIKQKILDCFPIRSRINRETPHLLYSMDFNLNWAITEFLDEHHFSGISDTETILRTFITLTSDDNNIQALTASQYLCQTWPLIGEEILSIVTKVIRDGHTSSEILGGKVAARILDRRICIEVTGIVDLIIEIGEILGWIGTVFQASPVEGVVYKCTPSIQNIKKNLLPINSNIDQIHSSQNYSCTIEYPLDIAAPDVISGDCWQSLFKYAVVAQGFPVLKRPKSIKGLEMDLSTMLTLCGAKHVGKFHSKITIKGFSSIISLSEHHKGISVWHFSRSDRAESKGYMSYADAIGGTEHQDLAVQEVLQDRHFVGWCSQFRYGAGALDSCYKVQPSGLPRASDGCYLQGKSIQRGHRIAVETVCVADKKHLPDSTGLQDYAARLERINSRPVVLWDLDKKRGWLVNGASALLHLVFASVEKDVGPFASLYCLRKSDLIQVETNTENAAAYILMNEQNLKLQIRSHLGRSTSLQDRAEDILFLLELILEEQTIALQEAKVPIRTLEGWEFVDVANSAPDVLHSTAFTPDRDCSGWLRMLEDSHAITLFGNNFGEIFSSSDKTACDKWITLPSDNCYLAAGIRDLKAMATIYRGNLHSVPQRLTENTIWPILRSTFEQCMCSTVSDRHSDMVQILVSKNDFVAQTDNSDILCRYPSDGAVIFGELADDRRIRSIHHVTSSVISGKRLGSDTDSQPYDSGIGSSISSLPTTKSPTPTLQESPSHSEYHVAIICALPQELLAVRALFDQRYSDPGFDENDRNSYAFGSMFHHKIVAACLPGIYGNSSATQVTADLRRSFPKVEFCLMVGIGGGIPSSKHDIRLGDVVVSRPLGSHSGVLRYDLEKLTQNSSSEMLGSFDRPPSHLLSTIRMLESDPDSQEVESFHRYIDTIGRVHALYDYPGVVSDVLYEASHSLCSGPQACTECSSHRIQRDRRKSIRPRIHYGLIACGDKVIKDARVRDQIGVKHNAICIDMEAAGVANVLSCLVIRGICDYADSHKDDIWQNYASATAAAFAKLVLRKVR